MPSLIPLAPRPCSGASRTPGPTIKPHHPSHVVECPPPPPLPLAHAAEPAGPPGGCGGRGRSCSARTGPERPRAVPGAAARRVRAPARRGAAADGGWPCPRGAFFVLPSVWVEWPPATEQPLKTQPCHPHSTFKAFI